MSVCVCIYDMTYKGILILLLNNALVVKSLSFLQSDYEIKLIFF